MGGIESTVAVKGRDDDIDLKRLEGELTGLMRRKRGLRPREESDFALNRSELVSDQLSILFDQLSFIGFLIGLFAMLVGGFGIANIMFVSVKERTSIIGIQKSLGAKNYFVLWQFLFEAIFLSIIGGLAGLFLVYLTTFIPLGSFQIVMSLKNILLGLIIAAFAGTISGIVPAIIAARMDPVVAIRS
jgi:putative ABC transport system permease protein